VFVLVLVPCRAQGSSNPFVLDTRYQVRYLFTGIEIAVHHVGGEVHLLGVDVDHRVGDSSHVDYGCRREEHMRTTARK
jgi:hypothetical protein